MFLWIEYWSFILALDAYLLIRQRAFLIRYAPGCLPFLPYSYYYYYYYCCYCQYDRDDGDINTVISFSFSHGLSSSSSSSSFPFGSRISHSYGLKSQQRQQASQRRLYTLIGLLFCTVLSIIPLLAKNYGFDPYANIPMCLFLFHSNKYYFWIVFFLPYCLLITACLIFSIAGMLCRHTSALMWWKSLWW